LKKSIKKLPRGEHETIRLYLSENSSFKEAAKKAGVTVDTYYKRYQRTLNNLHKISKEILEDDFSSENY
jgi:DNA-directed RNA polymerase specialized sigma24 family protein